MESRLSSSKKWVSLPQEYIQQIQNVFSENFKKYLQKAKIIVEGRIYPSELLLRVGYLEDQRLKQANFEISMEYNRKKENIVKVIYLGIDVLASLLHDFLEGGEDDNDLPRSWKDFQVEKRTVYIQYSTTNTQLEAQADELLGERTQDLVQGDSDDEELEGIIHMLGLNKEDENED